MPRTKLTILPASIIFLTSGAVADVSFAPPAVIETPGATADIIVHDLDGDGDLDIASLEVDFNFPLGEATGMVNVVLNDGEAGFPTFTSFGLGTVGGLEFAFRTLVATDLDGDGDPDLAAIGTTSPLVLLFNDGNGGFGAAINTGDGTFATPTAFETAVAPIDLHLGRFNDDKHLDLLVTHSLGNRIIAIYTGNGGGAFADAIILPSPDGTIAAAGDLNGDGLDDVVISTTFVFSSGPIAVLINRGSLPADIDGDGIVGFADLILLLAAWGPCSGCPEDIDGDGRVGFSDLLLVLANWS